MRRMMLAAALAAMTAFGLGAIQADDQKTSGSDTAAFFNGKDFTGFEGLIEDYWSVKDGAIVGKTNGLSFNTFLCSKKQYSDFEMKFQVKMIGGNSGIQIRSKIHDMKKFAVTGPQCDM